MTDVYTPLTTHSRRFELHRDTDISGVSGTGVVADGVAFPDGTVALRWRSAWPTSVVFHDRGVEGVEAIHGHGGATRIVWLDVATGGDADTFGLALRARRPRGDGRGPASARCDDCGRFCSGTWDVWERWPTPSIDREVCERCARRRGIKSEND